MSEQGSNALRDGVPYPNPKSVDQAKANLRFYRSCADMSQSYVAHKLGLQSPTVNRWESHNFGGFIPLSKVNDVAALLNADPKDLTIEIDALERFADGDEAGALDGYTGFPVSLCYEPKTLADFKNNLKYFRLRNGLSQRDLANRLGMTQSTISIWERLDIQTVPTRGTYALIADMLGAQQNLIIPPVDIANGWTTEPEQPQAINDADRVFDKSSNVECIGTLSVNDALLNMPTHTCAGAGSELPLEMQGDATVSELVGLQVSNGIAAAKLSNDSMYNPLTGSGIPKGAVVLIDTSKKDLKECLGKIVCYKVGGQYMVKRLNSNQGKLNGASDNPMYFPIFYEENEHVELIGEVVNVVLCLR